MSAMQKFVRLRSEDDTWQAFQADWKRQCEELSGDFDLYENGPFDVVRSLAEGNVDPDAAAYALHDGARYGAMCQVNTTYLPGYTDKVLRVRIMYLAPYYDLGEGSVEEYIGVVSALLWNVIGISNSTMPAPNIKFHLRSPADRQFFVTFGNNLDSAQVFKSVVVRGSWLYITKN